MEFVFVLVISVLASLFIASCVVDHAESRLVHRRSWLDAPSRTAWMEGTAVGGLIWASLNVETGAWWGLGFAVAGLLLGLVYASLSVRRKRESTALSA